MMLMLGAKTGGAEMPAKKSAVEQHVHRHQDGSIWAIGPMAGDVPTGFWEWYRKDGTRLRSGHFENGIQIGQWTTYDKSGAVYKVTTMKSLSKPKTKSIAAAEAKSNSSALARTSSRPSTGAVLKGKQVATPKLAARPAAKAARKPKTGPAASIKPLRAVAGRRANRPKSSVLMKPANRSTNAQKKK